jgi:hypothetical protein
MPQVFMPFAQTILYIMPQVLMLMFVIAVILFVLTLSELMLFWSNDVSSKKF